MRAGPRLKFTFALSLNERFFWANTEYKYNDKGWGWHYYFKKQSFQALQGKALQERERGGVQNAQCRPCRSLAMQPWTNDSASRRIFPHLQNEDSYLTYGVAVRVTFNVLKVSGMSMYFISGVNYYLPKVSNVKYFSFFFH